MPRALTALLLVTAAVFAGCGGADVAYTEVKTPPEGLPIPDNTGTVAAAADDTAGSGRDNNDNVTTSPTDDTATDTTGTATAPTTSVPTTPEPVTPVEPIVPEDTTDDDTGAAAPPSTDDTVPTTPDTGGGAVAPPDDQFCADNPGAC